MSHEDWDNGSWTSVLKEMGDTGEPFEDDEDLYSTSAGSVNGKPEKNKKLFQEKGRAYQAESEMSPVGGSKEVTPQAQTTEDTKRPQDASGQQEESWKPYQGTKAERIAWGVDKPEEVKPVLGSKRLGSWKEKLQAFGGDDTARASIDARRKEQRNRKEQELIDRRTKTIEGYQDKGAVGQAAHALGDQAAHSAKRTGQKVTDTVEGIAGVGELGVRGAKAGYKAGRNLAGQAWQNRGKIGETALRGAATALDPLGLYQAGANRLKVPVRHTQSQVGDPNAPPHVVSRVPHTTRHISGTKPATSLLPSGQKLSGGVLQQLQREGAEPSQTGKYGSFPQTQARTAQKDEAAYQRQLRQMQDAAKKPPGPTDAEQEAQVAGQIKEKDLQQQIASGKKPMTAEDAANLAMESNVGTEHGKDYIKPPDYQKIVQELQEVNQKIAEVYDKHSDNEEKFLEERKKILEEQKQLMERVQQ